MPPPIRYFYTPTVPWNHALPAGVLLILGVVVILNAKSLSENIRSAQKQFLPFARPDDMIDKPGLLGPVTPNMRVWSMRGVGIVMLVMSALIMVNGFMTA